MIRTDVHSDIKNNVLRGWINVVFVPFRPPTTVFVTELAVIRVLDLKDTPIRIITEIIWVINCSRF